MLLRLYRKPYEKNSTVKAKRRYLTAKKISGKNLRVALPLFLLRLGILLILCTVFMLSLQYLPQSITYEYAENPQKNSASAEKALSGTLSVPQARGNIRNHGAYVLERCSEGENLLCLSDNSDSILILSFDGSVRGEISLDSMPLTPTDIELLRNGILLSENELCELILSEDAELFPLARTP